MKKQTVYIIDDDHDILDVVKIVLEDEGYQVLATTNPNNIFTNPDKPDLYLIDIWMSGQNGKDVCLKLKSSSEYKHIPVILFSANKDTPQIATDAGADDFLLKPFDIEVLLRKVNGCLQRS